MLMSRRRISAWRWFLPLVVCVFVAFAANGFELRDSDMPLFRGAMYGKRVAPWLAMTAAVSLPIAILWHGREDDRRGFEVVQSEGGRR